MYSLLVMRGFIEKYRLRQPERKATSSLFFSIVDRSATMSFSSRFASSPTHSSHPYKHHTSLNFLMTSLKLDYPLIRGVLRLLQEVPLQQSNHQRFLVRGSLSDIVMGYDIHIQSSKIITSK